MNRKDLTECAHYARVAHLLRFWIFHQDQVRVPHDSPRLSGAGFIRQVEKAIRCPKSQRFFSLQLILEEADGFALRSLTRAEFYFRLFAFVERHRLTWAMVLVLNSSVHKARSLPMRWECTYFQAEFRGVLCRGPRRWSYWP